MEKKLQDTSNIFELSSEELEQVSGGVRNQDTEAFRTFYAAMLKGYMDAGGTLTFVAL